MSLNKTIFLLYVQYLLLNSILSQTKLKCLSQEETDNRISYETHVFSNSNEIKLILIGNSLKYENEVEKYRHQNQSVVIFICNKDLTNTNLKLYKKYRTELENIDCNKKTIEECLEINMNKDKILLQSNAKVLSKNDYPALFTQLQEVSNFKSSRHKRLILSLIIFTFFSFIFFVLFRKTVDWASSAKSELNRYKDAKAKYLIEKIDSKFNYILQIDV